MVFSGFSDQDFSNSRHNLSRSMGLELSNVSISPKQLYFFANDSKEIILYPFLSNKDATVVFPVPGVPLSASLNTLPTLSPASV
jgi:hypothetical protein